MNAAGSSSAKPPKLPPSVTTSLLEHWFDYIQSAERNSMPSAKPSRAARSPKPPKAPTATSRLEAEFALQLRAHAVTGWTREFRFHPMRKWRFDFAFPEQKVAVEIDGGTWSNGRHNRGSGAKTDAEKYNAAQLQGWLVLRCVGDHLKDGSAIAWTKQALGVIDAS